MIDLTYNPDLIAEIAARFDLREPNRRALDAIVRTMVDRQSSNTYPELVADLATGVGKTFLMSALIDYAAYQGIRHVLVVTPGNVIYNKTLANFDQASTKYVAGADHQPVVITPENFRTADIAAALLDPLELKVFVFNVHQLISPTTNVSRKIRSIEEHLGGGLYAYLEQAEDLLVIADEHHVYHDKAKVFSAALRDLKPWVLVGLTATPAATDLSKVVFQYSLGEAIADGHVKTPVIVYRKDGTKDERTQLADACHLLRRKETAYQTYVDLHPELPAVKPVLFVVCTSIDHATEVGQLLAQPGYIGDPAAVLEVTSQSSDEALAALAAVEESTSPIRAIVSVNLLREGWDVRNIAVITALRRLASQGLTEQILGRGLRLPFGTLTGVAMVDQVDLVSHDSYRQLLAQKDILRQRVEAAPATVEVDENGAAILDLPVDDTATEPSTVGPAADTTAPTSRDSTSALIDATRSSDDQPTINFDETDDRLDTPAPSIYSRTGGAPQITFPRRESRMTVAAFTLSDIPDGDAHAAGARFITEVPTFLSKDALTATRRGDDIVIKITPQQNIEAQQTLTGIDTVRDDLAAAIFRQAAETLNEKKAARRITNAFLKGAGVTTGNETAEWGDNRRQQAILGMTNLIKAAYGNRKRERSYELIPVQLPVEPVVVDPPRDAYNDQFAKHTPFTGWQRNIMPIASFDAGSTEWKLAQLLDRDDDIAWWLRIYTTGPAFIPTADGHYFPDFIAIDTNGSHWVIEGKSDKNAADADVIRKKDAAEHWARTVRDNGDYGDYGDWHYIFATETHIKHAGSWAALKLATNPE